MTGRPTPRGPRRQEIRLGQPVKGARGWREGAAREGFATSDLGERCREWFSES